MSNISELKLDPKNANRHSEYGTRLLENSVRENGFGRSILISNDNVVIAGNGTVEAGAAIGMENVQIIENDGTKIIAVRRTDVKSGTAEFEKLALADNIVAMKNIVLDAEVVEAIAEEFPETKAWAGIVLDPPGAKTPTGDENTQQMNFQFSGRQIGKIKEAIKISKKINEQKFQKAENGNSNGNALYEICLDFVKRQKKSK